MYAAWLQQGGTVPAHPNCLQDNGVIKASCPCEPCAPQQQRCFYCWFHESPQPLLNHTSTQRCWQAALCACFISLLLASQASGKGREMKEMREMQTTVDFSSKKPEYKSYLIQLETVREKRLQCFQQQDRSVLLGKEVHATECQFC